MKVINLQVNASISGLAGFEYGKEIFDTQVRDKLVDLDDKAVIVFPNQIKRITSSFVKGFFSKLLNQYSYREIVDKIAVKTSSKELADSVFKILGGFSC